MKANATRALALCAAGLAACTTTDAPVPPNTLQVARVSAAPVLDGNANDPAWAAAKPLAVNLAGGANFDGKGGTTATLSVAASIVRGVLMVVVGVGWWWRWWGGGGGGGVVVVVVVGWWWVVVEVVVVVVVEGGGGEDGGGGGGGGGGEVVEVMVDDDDDDGVMVMGRW